MSNSLVEDKMELAELASKLFMYCDAREWQLLQDEVFTSQVLFDMSSAGGAAPASLPAREICDIWNLGFTGIDAIHHQAGHYLIKVSGDTAKIYAYAMAGHYKKSAVNGQTRMFVGSYDLIAERTRSGWRLNQFKYNLKYIDGNAKLE